MPKRPDPIDSLNLDDPDLERLVKLRYERFRQALKEERAQFGKDQFVEIDRGLGRREGFLAKVISGIDSITVDRAIAVQTRMGRSLTDLVNRMERPERIPISPPANYVTSFAGPRRGWRIELRDWVGTLKIGSQGANLSFDPWLLIREANKDREAAIVLADRHLDFLVHLKDEVFSPATIDNVCWLFGAIAYVNRSLGRLEEAAGFLDLAFQLETRINNLHTRAFLYRDCSYLLCHLGFISEAETCAQKSVNLCLVSPEAEGLGESLYARAVMAKWQGEPAVALTLLAGTFPYLANSKREVFCSAILFSAWLHLELGQTDIALGELRGIEGELESLPRLFLGEYRLARAVIYSKMGNIVQAEDDFSVAESVFSEHGSATDQALLLLWNCHHKLDAGLSVNGISSRLTRIAGKMKRGSSGEAAVLEVARLILAESLTAEALSQTIEILRKPWAQRSRARLPCG